MNGPCRVPIDPLALHSHEEGAGLHHPGIIGQTGDHHALVSGSFQHFERPLKGTDQFIERHVTIQRRPWLI